MDIGFVRTALLGDRRGRRGLRRIGVPGSVGGGLAGDGDWDEVKTDELEVEVDPEVELSGDK